jgi:DNA invertase Pin-like site-specific DNA recombinase
VISNGKRFVAYYRVSTQRQGESGLGLEAQRSAVEGFITTQGVLLMSHTEVETGKRADRPELAKALKAAKRSRATLVIAKLDRLARNVAFVSSLMESDVEFIACDNPHANRLTIHILAAVAEDEARRISERTTSALAAYKLRGGLLGARNPRCRQLSAESRRKGQAKGASVNKLNATAAYADLLPLIIDLRDQGSSLRQISRTLNSLGHRTRLGGNWTCVQIGRLLRRDGCAT